MSNNNGQNGRPGPPQQQLSPPTDPRTKRNVPSNTGSQTTQQRARASGSRQNDRYSTAMPMTASGSEHPPLYGYVPRALPGPLPPANVIALRDVLLMPPPPPPPLPLATTSAAPSSYTAPPSVTPTFACSHQIPKEFNPTRPPPALRPQLNASRKRGATDNIQAGPSSKIRQTELPDGPCTDCVQREIRASIYQEHSVKLEQDHKMDETKFNNRFENVENGKLWLKSIMSPRQYSLVENYVETGSVNNLFSKPSPSNSLASFLQGTSVAPRQSLLDQLLEDLLGGARNNSMAHLQPSTSREDSLLQILSGAGRRSAPPADSLDALGFLLEVLCGSTTETAPTSSSPDRLHALLEALHPTAESEQRMASERAGGSGNGLSRLANGGVPPGPLPAPVSVPVPAPAPAPVPYAVRPTRPYYAQPYPPPAPPSVPAPQPQPYYAPRYAAGAPQPAAPPPPAQHFAPPYYATARPPPPDPRAPPPPNQYPQFGSSYPPYYPPGPPGPPY